MSELLLIQRDHNVFSGPFVDPPDLQTTIAFVTDELSSIAGFPPKTLFNLRFRGSAITQGGLRGIIAECLEEKLDTIMVRREFFPQTTNEAYGAGPHSKFYVHAGGYSDRVLSEIRGINGAKEILEYCSPEALPEVVMALTHENSLKSPEVWCHKFREFSNPPDETNPMPAMYRVFAKTRATPKARIPFMNPNDAIVMIRYFDQLKSPQKPSIKAEEIVGEIDMRIYTEFCCNTLNPADHRGYKGEAFQQWVQEETHYALARAGYSFTQGAFKYPGQKYPDQDPCKQDSEPEEPASIETSTYQEMRTRVLHAVVDRAVDFCTSHEGTLHPKKGDPKNLRTSLEPYLMDITK